MHHLTRLSLRYPKTTAAVLAAVTAIFAAGLQGFRTEFGFRVLLGDDHPSIQRLDRMIEQFGGGFPVLIVWECGEGHPCEHALDESSLKMARDVTQQLTISDGVRSVHGITNSPILVPTPGGFDIRNFVEHGEIVSDADVLARRAHEDPVWTNELISSDGLVGAMFVQPVDTESTTDLSVVAAIERALETFEALGFRFALEGAASAQVVSGRELSESMSRIIPLTVLVIGLTVLLLTSSLQQTLLTLGSIGIALLWTFGLMGWLDWPQDGIHEVVAPLLLVVGVCDAMHYLSRFAVWERHVPRDDGLVVAAREVGPACLVTTLTTGAAFLSFTASDLSTFDRFGVITAFGTFACLLLTFTALPLAAMLLPDRAPPSSAGSLRFEAMIRRLMDAVCGRRSAVLSLAALLLAFFGIGWAAHLEAGSNWDEFFGADSTVRRWHRFVNTRFHPSQSLELELTLPPDEDIESPITLGRLSRIREHLAPIIGLEEARSILDRIDRANRLVHGDDPAFEHAGQSFAANAELLEILTLSSPDDIGRWLSMDRKHVRMSAAAPAISHADDTRVVAAARRSIEQTLPPGWHYSLSGQLAINADWVHDVLSTQLRSFPAALLVVSLILLAHFRSAFLTLASLLPTLIPVIVTLGAMGWLGVTLDVGRAMIAAILIGIGVDDAVHVLTHYQRTIRSGEPPNRAIRAAVHQSGRAIVTTSAALSLGFLTLMASAWETISSFGLFICLAILGALVSTLLVLPAVIFAFERAPQGIRELASSEITTRIPINGQRSESD